MGPALSRFLADPARAAAVAAARRWLEPGMTVGLGSGRAVFALIDGLGATWGPAEAAGGGGASPGARPELWRAVVPSSGAEARARAAGIDLVGLDDGLVLDLAVDGADEV